MELIKFAVFGAVILAGVWWLCRLMSRDNRNCGSDHGGGPDSVRNDIDWS